MVYVYYAHLGTTHKRLAYQGGQISIKQQSNIWGQYVDYAGVLVFKCPD